MVEDVIEELPTRRILEDYPNVSLGLDHLVEANDIRVRQLPENGNLTVDLR